MIDEIKNILKREMYKIKFPNSKIYKNVQIDTLSSVGMNSVLFSSISLINTVIGNYTYVQKYTSICNTEIGNYCSIASNVNIGLASHPINLISTSPVFYDNSQPLPDFFVKNNTFSEVLPRTYIGSDVWIGQSVMIKAGLSLGTGSIIGAGSIVTKDVQPYSIVVGVPAKTIKMRFSDDLIVELLNSKWWEEDPKVLKSLSCSFANPKEFLEKLRCLK
jgi:acetyltransferase-like isoleucine patch superfamily enzyme